MENTHSENSPTYRAAIAFNVEKYFENHSKLKQETFHELGKGTKITYADETFSNEVTATGKKSDLPRTNAANNGKGIASITILWPSMKVEEIETLEIEVEANFEEWKNDIEPRQIISNNPGYIFRTAMEEMEKHIDLERLQTCQAGFALRRSKDFPMDLAKMFAAIKLIQWANDQLDKMKAGENETAENLKSNREKWSLTRKMWLLKEIGFFSLPSIVDIQNQSTQKRNLLISMLADGDKDNIKKCLNEILTSNLPPDENHREHRDFIRDFIEKMKGRTPG